MMVLPAPDAKPSGSFYVNLLASDAVGGSHTGDQVETTVGTVNIAAGQVEQQIQVIVRTRMSVAGVPWLDDNIVRIYVGPPGVETLRVTFSSVTAQASSIDVCDTLTAMISGPDWSVANRLLVTYQSSAGNTANTFYVERVDVVGI